MTDCRDHLFAAATYGARLNSGRDLAGVYALSHYQTDRKIECALESQRI
ncbi:hypothetical protein [Paraburkholderia bonniea]|nr:hypothetical protein [Paraburkholderia bonniea]